ncbi:MAG: 23S rRNA (adenine(2503)-C(2))-methyltransferase RlmN [Cyanobacteria bacterium NC_groundwater_1444_Ag_S-0.65um_54_12]|nr:23S rRNA (adenine(2503)-C(2))-methyltransferase RlmN [Cyanobacteria bacterium NC_groundwater_1444_Ag_S-0.65um_54_12]
MIHLLGLETGELRELARHLGVDEYRGNQLANWLFMRRIIDIEAMTDLPKDFRRQLLKNSVTASTLKLIKIEKAVDHTQKFLFDASDGMIESVLLPQFDYQNPASYFSQPEYIKDPYSRVTACISTQLGCAVGCRFCATGLSGFARNLLAAEMVEQVIQLQNTAGLRVSHVVFMGLGEPLLNYPETLKAVQLLNRELGIGMRHITVSTVGIIPQMERLATERLQLTLAVSLHAPNDELRNFLVPINRRYPLADLRLAIKHYLELTGRRLTIEYVMLRGINDQPQLARELITYLHGIPVHINLIPYNSTDTEFQATTPEAIAQFQQLLESAGKRVTLRRARGAEIRAACGQLKAACRRN